jgi:hypothetical protein
MIDGYRRITALQVLFASICGNCSHARKRWSLKKSEAGDLLGQLRTWARQGVRVRMTSGEPLCAAAVECGYVQIANCLVLELGADQAIRRGLTTLAVPVADFAGNLCVIRYRASWSLQLQGAAPNKKCKRRPGRYDVGMHV